MRYRKNTATLTTIIFYEIPMEACALLTHRWNAQPAKRKERVPKMPQPQQKIQTAKLANKGKD